MSKRRARRRYRIRKRQAVQWVWPNGRPTSDRGPSPLIGVMESASEFARASVDCIRRIAFACSVPIDWLHPGREIRGANYASASAAYRGFTGRTLVLIDDPQSDIDRDFDP